MPKLITPEELSQRAADHVEAVLASYGRPVRALVTTGPDGSTRCDVPCMVESSLAAKIGLATGAAVAVDAYPALGRSIVNLRW